MKVTILGSGNIGTDLLVKILKSKHLECVMFAGQRENSPGLQKAKELGVPTSSDGIDAILATDAKIVFDATNSENHKKIAPLLKNRFVIDLTPAKIAPICIPSVNLKSCLKEKEVNMGSCTVQAVIPRLAKIKDLDYVEVVSTIASDSAGMSTRQNLSEYLVTTAKTIEKFTGAKAKSILVINPVLQKMHNTIYYKVKGSDKVRIIQFEIDGQGDYLDKRFGNLDIMTVNALKVAEEYAKKH